MRSGKPWRLTIEGVILETGVGDMAIDDLSLVDGPCSSKRLCDFEADLCGFEPWQNKTWTRGQPTATSVCKPVDRIRETSVVFWFFVFFISIVC